MAVPYRGRKYIIISCMLMQLYCVPTYHMKASVAIILGIHCSQGCSSAILQNPYRGDPLSSSLQDVSPSVGQL